MADVRMKFVENILELIISELIHEDIEKIGDAGKEDGREALAVFAASSVFTAKLRNTEFLNVQLRISYVF